METELSEKTEIRKAEPSSRKTVCFVCTGNTCRSPMAQAYLLHALQKRGRQGELRVLSAGLCASDGQPISPNAVTALADAGIVSCPENPYAGHRALTLDLPTVLACDDIVCLTRAHAMQAILRFPQAAGRIRSFARDIPDPWGGDAQTYRACLDAIAREADAMFFGDGDENRV